MSYIGSGSGVLVLISVRQEKNEEIHRFGSAIIDTRRARVPGFIREISTTIEGSKTKETSPLQTNMYHAAYIVAKGHDSERNSQSVAFGRGIQ